MRHALDLGPNIVRRLIPQRPPLLLVDRVLWFEDGAHPRARCARTLAADEPVFAGHFPGEPVWPGAYTIEGLAQTTSVVGALAGLLESIGDAAQALRGLRGEAPPPDGPPSVGMIAAVDVKLLEPIGPGATIEYDARRTHTLGDAARFAVEAWVEGRPAARGSITAARVARPR